MMTDFLAIMSVILCAGILSLWVYIIYQYLNTPSPIPHCPHCYEYLIEMDGYDMDIDYNEIIVGKIGYCPQCKKQYTWQTEFIKKQDYNIKEVG